jgi:bifunctional DNA-binding transcriptional regulator/antitoxin component of YhaV-PrlF toxin-antitoxin module
MQFLVGTKGQVVIDSAIRRQLGIEPGWIATQRVVGDRVELTFSPPRHNKSARGLLQQYAKPISTESDWDEIRRQSWVTSTQGP